MTQSSWHITWTITNTVLEVGQAVSSKSTRGQEEWQRLALGRLLVHKSHLARTHPTTIMMPKGRVSSTRGVENGEPKRWARLWAKRVPENVLWTWGHRGCRKGYSADQKVHTKGKKGAKGKLAKVPKQETEEDLPVESGETKNEASLDSDKTGEKKAIWLISPATSYWWPLSPFLHDPKEYFYLIFCKYKAFRNSGDIFKKRISLPSLFMCKGFF